MKIDVGDVEFKNAITYLYLNKLFLKNLRGGLNRIITVTQTSLVGQSSETLHIKGTR